jgi:hypothetical protein
VTSPLLTLEGILTSAAGADIRASVLQREVCRALDGRPVGELVSRDVLLRTMGVDTAFTWAGTLVVLVCGVRAGKSMLTCCGAIHACLTAALAALKTHELPRFAIVGPTIDSARATFILLMGILRSSPVLRGMIEGETADSVTLRRQDGRRVEIVVVAAHRGGLSVRNRWLVGFVLEEVAQFNTEATGAVVSAEELLRAGETRLLPGCHGWLVSSPFGPTGLLYDLWRRHFGNPGRVLVVHADTRAMNPSFSQATIDAIRAESPDVAAREYDAQWLDAESAWLDSKLVDAATRTHPPVVGWAPRGARVVAAMDAATRGNAWTLAVAWAEGMGEDRRVVVAGAWQWIGSKSHPLSPAAVLGEIAGLLAPYQCKRIACDQWAFDANRDLAARHGLQLAERVVAATQEAYARLRTLLASGAVELPPVAAVRTDLVSIRRRATAGGVRIELPKTADGRHCDFAPSIANAVAMAASGAGVAQSASETLRMRLPRSERAGLAPAFSDWTGSAAKRDPWTIPTD